LRLTEPQQLVLRDAVATAQAVPGLTERVDAVYAEVQQAIDVRRPRCDVSGRCCQFEKFGHLLFVTTVELAAFDLRRPANDEPDGDGCRYQINGRCTAHAVRPFGCRIFFCDPTAEGWQEEQYELFHTRLKRLHNELDVPYLYVEWRQGLRVLRGR
jgi:Fe-S-cluster containining protein